MSFKDDILYGLAAYSAAVRSDYASIKWLANYYKK